MFTRNYVLGKKLKWESILFYITQLDARKKQIKGNNRIFKTHNLNKLNFHALAQTLLIGNQCLRYID